MKKTTNKDVRLAEWRLLSLCEQERNTTPAFSDYDLDKLTPSSKPLIPAAVLIAILSRGDEQSILLTKRTSNLAQHSGQIAFPGGKIDQYDQTALNAAMREAKEEVGIKRSNLTPLGMLPAYQTVTGFSITPIVATLEPPFEFRAEPGEVEEIFELPLGHIFEKRNFEKHSLLYEGKKRHYWAVPYNDYYIWGATAAILRELAARAEQNYL